LIRKNKYKITAFPVYLEKEISRIFPATTIKIIPMDINPKTL
jgi:hypothetical protein